MSEDERVAIERRMATLEADYRAMAGTLESLSSNHDKLINYMVGVMLGALALMGTSVWEAIKAGWRL